jgi:pimeloyl-ACP methyl ester carboxylesterase
MMEQRFDEVNGITIHAIQEGDAHQQVIVFLHGFPEYSYAWHKQLPFFAAQGFYALAPDQRGYNLSSKPKGVKSYVIDTLVEDMAAWIQQLTPHPVILVGHDWGGGVAWALALKYPHLLSKLVILNMPHWAVMKQQLKSNFKQMLKSWYVLFFQIPALPQILSRMWNFKLMAKSLTGTSNKGTFSRQDLLLYKSAWRQPSALTSMINWYRALKYDLKKSYGKVTVPTLVIWGKNDTALSFEMARLSVDQCTNGTLKVIDDATHWLHHEKPDMVNNLILDFARSQ